jgi:methylated-DNA-protein-cysteine methyltransferase-like protein
MAHVEDPFTTRVVSVIKAIPTGRVATYGQVAALAGSPRGARQVVRILHTQSRKHGLPWHRVINARGLISLPEGRGYELQRGLLEAEGVQFEGERIELKTWRWDGAGLVDS